MKRILFVLAIALGLSGLTTRASAEGGAHGDKFPEAKMSDVASLQTGARIFVNYCLNCHAAAYMRYNRMHDIGLSDDQIKKNMLFATEKVGDVMKVSIDPKQAKDFFGANPPDLTVIARSRSGEGGSGADYLYTYLRTFYRDDTSATGWNNLAFPKVAMPHVLWELQGQRAAKFKTEKNEHTGETETLFEGFEQLTPGTMSPQQYDETIADLVAYLQWMSEPAQGQRVRLGVWVLLFLGLFVVFAWRLNAAYWKDVK